ncbi:MAG: ribonuclease P [Thermoplasmata archaeon]
MITKKDIDRIAQERIDNLFKLSLETGNERYIIIMENIAKRMDITLPGSIKRLYCKKCKKPYKNPRIRIKNNQIIVTCSNCGNIRRYMINR